MSFKTWLVERLPKLGARMPEPPRSANVLVSMLHADPTLLDKAKAHPRVLDDLAATVTKNLPQTALKRLEGSIANLDKAVHAARKTLDGRWVKTLRVIAGQADLTTLSTQVGILKLDLPAFAAMATANKKDLDVDRFRAQFNALE